MATTYEKIASVTVGSGGAANIEFTNIPATFDDLVLKVSIRDNNSGRYWSNINLRFNGSTTNYSEKILFQADGTAGSNERTGDSLFFAYGVSSSSTSNTFSNVEYYIPNYIGSTNKSVSSDSVTENNGTQVILSMQAGLWSNTSVINQITLIPYLSASFVQYSTATLYGIKKS